MVVKIQRPDNGWVIALSEDISYMELPPTLSGPPTGSIKVVMRNGTSFDALPWQLQEIENWMVDSHTVATPNTQSAV